LLSECVQHIPKNANYTSPVIQNEIIEILSDMVRESVVADIRNADVPWFTLMEDGTRDKNNRKNISIAIRYVKNGKVFESLLGIYTTKELDAKNFTDLTLDIMKKKKQFRHFASSESMLRRCQCHEWQNRRCCRINLEEIKEECAVRILC
jgi:hypothetical protein